MGLMKNKILLWGIIINLSSSFLIVVLIWYTGRFLQGLLYHIGLVLWAPSFFVIFLLKGPTNAMHFTRDTTFLLVSFISYVIIIALIETIVFKWKKRRGASENDKKCF